MASTKSLVDTTTVVHPDELNHYYRNPRRGDVPAIARSLAKLKQYKPITVNVGTRTGRPNEVLAGNHTLQAIRELAGRHPDEDAWRQVKVHWVDEDEATCKEINVADNRTAELGGYDEQELASLLLGMPEESLAAVGYTADDLADLKAVLEEQNTAFDTIVDRPPRQQSDGLINSNDIETDGLGYADSATRMIVLIMPISQFVWAQTQLERLRQERDVKTNSDVLLALLAERSGESPPEGDSEA